ncbi:hypothetical protein [Streptomyces montanisoli]|uniref:hypothetical protein n=1 Tax=Streptomyces montanisoli TaxID=2798581 RepID=UPI001FD8667E|nr:hypothetical protein [Streptomyces montanisoli]
MPLVLEPTYRFPGPHLAEHKTHEDGLAAISHLVISPTVPAEPEYLISVRAGSE